MHKAERVFLERLLLGTVIDLTERSALIVDYSRPGLTILGLEESN